MKKILLSIAFAAAAFSPMRGVAQSVEELADVMWYKTSYKEISAERRTAMNEMQKYADSFTDTLFEEYLNTTAGTEKEQALEGWGLMRFYNMALEKLLQEIPATKVKKGEVVMWQLYNMG